MSFAIEDGGDLQLAAQGLDVLTQRRQVDIGTMFEFGDVSLAPRSSRAASSTWVTRRSIRIRPNPRASPRLRRPSAAAPSMSGGSQPALEPRTTSS